MRVLTFSPGPCRAMNGQRLKDSWDVQPPLFVGPPYIWAGSRKSDTKPTCKEMAPSSVLLSTWKGRKSVGCIWNDSWTHHGIYVLLLFCLTLQIQQSWQRRKAFFFHYITELYLYLKKKKNNRHVCLKKKKKKKKNFREVEGSTSCIVEIDI